MNAQREEVKNRTPTERYHSACEEVTEPEIQYTETNRNRRDTACERSEVRFKKNEHIWSSCTEKIVHGFARVLPPQMTLTEYKESERKRKHDGMEE